MAKEKKSKKKSTSKKKEEVHEVFEVDKGRKEKIIESEGEQEVVEVKEGQIETENKILRNVFIIVGVLFLVFLGVFFWMQSIKHFEYRGVDFDIVDTQNVRFYHTSFPLILEAKEILYNVYLRKDPRENEKNVPIEGEILFSEKIVLNSTSSFNCEGEGVIAVANFNQIFTALGVEVIRDPNATCDLFGRFAHINLEEGNETKIERYGPRCYRFEINDCEILEATERYIIEAVVNMNN